MSTYHTNQFSHFLLILAALHCAKCSLLIHQSPINECGYKLFFNFSRVSSRTLDFKPDENPEKMLNKYFISCCQLSSFTVIDRNVK